MSEAEPISQSTSNFTTPALSEDLLPLARFILALRDPLPFANGSSMGDYISDSPEYTRGSRTGLPVLLTTWQLRLGEHDAPDLGGAVSTVGERYKTGWKPAQGPQAAPVVLSTITIAEFVTVARPLRDRSFSQPLPAGDLLPDEDALIRCLRFTEDLARAYRITVNRPHGVTTYDRLAFPVLAYVNSGKALAEEPGFALDPAHWRGPQLVLPDHLHRGEFLDAPSVTDSGIVSSFDEWMRDLRHGAILFAYQDIVSQASRAFAVHGEYGQSVILAAVGCEMLFDQSLLALF